MAKAKACIYCGESDKKFCKAHILPLSLGAFENQPTLLNKVCADCNTEIGKYEDHFIHTCPVALFRPILGLAQDKNRSPFRRCFAGQGPIDEKSNYLGTEDVLLEPDGVGDNNLPLAMPLPQLHLIDTDGNKKCIRINPESFTPVEVSQVIGEIKPKQIQFFGLDEEQYEHIIGAFCQAGIPLSEEQEVHPPTDKPVLPILTRVVFTRDTRRYFQAIAKIALHYYLGMNLDNCYLNGSEDVFNPVRRFIRYGEGNPEVFVIEKKGYFIDDPRIGRKPPFYMHVFLAEVSNKCIKVKTQFCVGLNIPPSYYEVLLCQKPFIISIQPTIFGHNYVYIEPSKRKKFAGTIHQLGVNNRIMIPPRFR